MVNTDQSLANDADWEALGPFGGDVWDVAASPTAPNVLLAGLAPVNGIGNLYRSIDGGDTWTKVDRVSNGDVYSVVFAADGTAYIGVSHAAWKSVDDGETWSILSLDIGLPDSVVDLAVDPNDANTIWAGIDDELGRQSVNLMRSLDGGSTWEDMTPPTERILGGQAVALDPHDSSRVFAGFSGTFGREFWVSIDGGDTWADRSAGLPDAPFRDAVHDGTRILVTGGTPFDQQDFGLYESTDLGVTWNELSSDWPVLVANDVEFDAHDPFTLYAATTGDGLYRSRDGGLSWEFSIGNTEGLTLQSVRLATSPDRLLLGVDRLGVLRSVDEGETFSVASEGIQTLQLTSVASNPADMRELAVAVEGVNEGAVYRSIDGGQSWSLEAAPLTRYNAVEFSPSGTLYALSGGPSSIAPEGLYRRESDGAWTALGPDQGNLYESNLFSIAFDAGDPDLIFLGGEDTFAAGDEPTVWRSDDAGASWTKVYEGASSSDRVMAIRSSRESQGAIWLAAFSEAFPPFTGGVLRSVDGGLTWESTSDGLRETVQGTDLCESAHDPMVFYLADGDPAGGVWRTEDGGQSWFAPGYTDHDVRGVGCDPRDDRVVYDIEAGDSQALRSSDGAATFELFNNGLSDVDSPTDIDFVDTFPPRLLIATGSGAFTTQLLPALRADGSCPGTLTVRYAGGTPGELLAVIGADARGNSSVPAGPCAGTDLGLARPQLLAGVTADAAGRAARTVSISADRCGEFIQVVDLAACTTSNVWQLP